MAGPVFHPVDPFTISKVGRDINGGKLKGGDIIEWKITVTNTGLTQTTHVVVTDTVPNTTTYVKRSIRGKGANDSKQPKLRWNIGTMAVGEKQVVKFRSRVKKGLPAGTRIRNQAVVRSDQSRPEEVGQPEDLDKRRPDDSRRQDQRLRRLAHPAGRGLDSPGGGLVAVAATKKAGADHRRPTSLEPEGG